MSQDLIELIEELEVAWHRAFMVLPSSQYMENPGLGWIMTDHSFAMINAVYSTRLENGRAREVIDRTLRVFGDNHMSMTWSVGPAAQPTDLAKHLMDAGLKQADSLVGMSLDIRELNRGKPDNSALELVQIVDLEKLEQGLKVFTQSFNFPDDARGVPYDMYSRLGAIGDKGWTHFVALDNGEIVGFCSRLRKDATVAIHNVSVLPHHRGQGIASALVAEALQASRHQGCDLAVLHATPMGLGVYRRMGFVERCEIQAFRYEL